MRTVRHSLIAALLILVIAATPACSQTNSKEIMAKGPAELVEVLKNPGSSAFDKAKACQRLAVVGTKDAVPALAALLADEKLNVYARFGLEPIADPSVDVALRDAATKLQGTQLVGVLGSIGQRKDAQAVGLLKGLLGNADATVASAAAGALGQIGTSEAANVLKEALGKDSPVKNWIADASLACADGLVAAGKQAEAVALLDVAAKSDIPKYIKVAALGGLFRIQKGEAKDLLIAQIRHADKTYFNAGLAAARDMPGADVTAALAAEVAKLPAERQAVLLRVLGDRKDPAPMPLVLAASKSDSPAVREAAIIVLAKHGDASAAAVLLDAALGDDEVAQTAKAGLKNLPGAEIDAAIVARLNGADAKAKAVLFELLGARRVVAAAPTIREALADGNESIRVAAIGALAWVAELNDIDVLAAKAMTEGDAPETAAARVALRMAALRMSDRDACAAKLAGRLAGASAANQVAVLELLGKVSGQKSLETVVANVKSADPAIKDAAARVLGGWLNADAAPALLEIVKSDPDTKYQIRALRGYIRIARQLQLPAETKLAMFKTAMEVAKRNDEKKIALDILTRIPSAETVNLAASYAGDAALKDAAAEASVKIAAKLMAQDPKAVAAAMQKVVDAKPSEAFDARAKHLLGQATTAAK